MTDRTLRPPRRLRDEDTDVPLAGFHASLTRKVVGYPLAKKWLTVVVRIGVLLSRTLFDAGVSRRNSQLLFRYFLNIRIASSIGRAHFDIGYWRVLETPRLAADWRYQRA